MGVAISWVCSWFQPGLSREELRQLEHDANKMALRKRIAKFHDHINGLQTLVRNQRRETQHKEKQLEELKSRAGGFTMSLTDRTMAINLLKEVSKRERKVISTMNGIQSLEGLKDALSRKLDAYQFHELLQEDDTKRGIDMDKLQDTVADMVDEANETIGTYDSFSSELAGVSNADEDVDWDQRLNGFLTQPLQVTAQRERDILQIIVEPPTAEPLSTEGLDRRRIEQAKRLIEMS